MQKKRKSTFLSGRDSRSTSRFSVLPPPPPRRLRRRHPHRRRRRGRRRRGCCRRRSASAPPSSGAGSPSRVGGSCSPTTPGSRLGDELIKGVSTRASKKGTQLNGALALSLSFLSLGGQLFLLRGENFAPGELLMPVISKGGRQINSRLLFSRPPSVAIQQDGFLSLSFSPHFREIFQVE